MADETQGRLIAVEGIDGSGKSTQIRLLNKWLNGLDRKVFFSEWNSSPLVAEATKKGKRSQLLTPATFSLIHATDFADRYERQILPMLKAGYIVLCDRYVYTAYARDAARGCEPAWLRAIYGFARKPDITFFFHTPVHIALARILSARKRPNWFEAGMDLELHWDIQQSFLIFQDRVSSHYLDIVDEFDLVRIEATDDIHDQQAFVRERVSELIDLAPYETTTEVLDIEHVPLPVSPIPPSLDPKGHIGRSLEDRVRGGKRS